MDLRRYLLALRKHWLAITALTVLGGLIAGAYALTQPVLYRATSSVFLSTERGASNQDLLQGSAYTLATVQSYADLATMPAVLNPVIQDLKLATTPTDLASRITTNIRLNTVIIEVSAMADSAKGAADLANAVTASLSKVLPTLAPSTGTVSAVSLKPVATATPPQLPAEPRYLLILVAGVVGGLVLGVAYAVIRDLFDTRFRSEEDAKTAAADAGVTFLGSIDKRHGRDLPHLSVVAEPHGRAAEAYRRLVTNLEFAGVDARVKAITVTSALAGDGKTTTALNLAAAIAERGQRVLLVDADLRRPTLADYLNIEGAVGITNVLLGGVSAEDGIQKVGSFDVLPSGTTPPNATQLLTSGSMARLFTELRARYDYIVVDSPPVLAVPDALTIANLTDGALVVTRQKVTRSRQLIEAVQSLTFVGATVLGVVLNAATGRTVAGYGYEGRGGSEDTSLRAASTPPTSFFRGHNPPSGSRTQNKEGLEKVGASDS